MSPLVLLFVIRLRVLQGINIKRMLPFANIIYVRHDAARRNLRMDIYFITTFGPSKLEAANVNLEEEYSLIYKRLCNLTQSIESLASRSYCDLNIRFTKVWKINETKFKLINLNTTFGPSLSILDAAYVNLQEEYSVIYERTCNLTQSIESLAFRSYCDLKAIIY